MDCYIASSSSVPSYSFGFWILIATHQARRVYHSFSLPLPAILLRRKGCGEVRNYLVVALAILLVETYFIHR